LTDLLLSTSTHLSHYSTSVEGMKGLKPGETCLTAWVKTQRLAAGSFCQPNNAISTITENVLLFRFSAFAPY
jgi:hypothetical protein